MSVFMVLVFRWCKITYIFFNVYCMKFHKLHDMYHAVVFYMKCKCCGTNNVSGCGNSTSNCHS